MDNFIVSARKYRPTTFETVVGQQHITGTLKNAIKNNQLAQAFLFCGPRGVGKTTCARILAKTINCLTPTADMEACGTCESCVSFQTGHSFNFHELDAASNNSVDDIRSLIEQVRIPPQAGKYKIYIIDEVHMLSASAFNAFLKTLEEPPSYAIFILATTEKHKILPTILSRCQIFDFNRIQVEDIANHLLKIAQREEIKVEQDGLHIIAQKADGGLRDALSMFDQIVSYTSKDVTYKAVIENLNILDYDYYFQLVESLTRGDVGSALILFDEVLNNGFDGNHFINGLASHLRNLLVGKDPQTIKLLEVSENIKQKYLSQSQQTDLGFILTALNLANQCDLIYKNSKNQRLQVELSLIKMCHTNSAIQLAKLPLNTTATDEDQNKKKTAELTESPFATKPQAEKEPELPAPDQAPVAVITPPVSQEAPIKLTPLEQIPEVINLPPTKPSATSGSIKLPGKGTQKSAASLIPSLTDLERIAHGNAPKEPQFLTGDARESFTFDQLFELWNAYAQKSNENGRINVYTLLTQDQPVLEEPATIILNIENRYQEEILRDEMIELLNYLRSELKNFDIVITTRLIEKKQVKRLYTSIEKYQYLIEKNPKLEDMRKQFNLDIDP